MLSRNVWFSNKLIETLELEEILQYFKIAVDILEKYSNIEITYDNKKYLEKGIGDSLMFILGLLRRRDIDRENKKLSMNNEEFQRCYKVIEKLSEKELEINSFLNLKNKIDNRYKNISNLLVIVAKYLTGYKIDIKIDTDDENK